PGAHAVWEQVAALAGSGSGADPRLAADLLEHRALTTALAGAPDCHALFAESRDAHLAVGQRGRAALAELRIATAGAQFGAEPAEIRALLASAVRSAEALDGAEPDRVRRVASAELTHIRFEAFLRDSEGAEGEPDGASQLASELAEFITAKDGGDHADDLAVLIADAEALLAQCALRGGNQEQAERLLAAAADRTIAAHRPWEA
ncbi:hypothetical protein P8605_36350, partial [Streptomyces sp. T-3]|nr:hypothetical protein [Streptomyces sp. T-3]